MFTRVFVDATNGSGATTTHLRDYAVVVIVTNSVAFDEDSTSGQIMASLHLPPAIHD